MAVTVKSDSECIQTSYEDQMGGLFKQLFMSLTGEPDAKNDQIHLARFKTGVGILHRAKGLALGVVGPTAAASADVLLPTALMSEPIVPAAPTKQRKRKSEAASKVTKTPRRKASTV